MSGTFMQLARQMSSFGDTRRDHSTGLDLSITDEVLIEMHI